MTTGTNSTVSTGQDSKSTFQPFTSNVAPTFIIGSAIFSIFWGLINAWLVSRVDMEDISAIETLLKASGADAHQPLNNEEEQPSATKIMEDMNFIGGKITEGAISFLAREYLYLGVFSGVFAVVLGVTVDGQEMGGAGTGLDYRMTNWPYTATAYLVGSATSILAGYIGMRIAVYTNTRTTFQCCKGADNNVHVGFLTAFSGGQVLGFVLVGLALLILEVLLIVFKAAWFDGAIEQLKAHNFDSAKQDAQALDIVRTLFELIAGYGLGGSSVALFGRVGGGIYTKAADVGADLVGKTIKDLKEDDPSNPGTIADNVGDNVGDIAGMGADLFGSLAESTCAALVVSSTSRDLVMTTDALYFPLMVTASGIIASFLSVLFVHLWTVTTDNVQTVLKGQIGISTVIMTGTVIPALWVLPEDDFTIPNGKDGVLTVNRWTCYGCIMFGLWSGMVIGFITEYYTSNSYAPTLKLSQSCKSGPAPNIIRGLALGYASTVIPITAITATIYFSFSSAGMYGIGLSALGMLGSLPVALSIDGYGPISDNAGGIAEMSGLPAVIRDRTDALDAAGNTTAAVGKGFAIGSACLVGLALFGAFITRVQDHSVDILQPVQFAGLLMGAMLPYAFSAMTMEAVGDAAEEMMAFIIEDYARGELEIKNGGKYDPDYDGCISISTEASLKKMVAPGALVIFSPLIAGFLFGPPAVAGLLAGAIVSGVQVAISASNTGGAWDNAKKEVERQRSLINKEVRQQGIDIEDYKHQLAEVPEESTDEKHVEMRNWVKKVTEIREQHVAAVIGDTVGDPLKDTSGPAINILIKLSAITSLVFGSFIKKYNAFGPKDVAPAAAAPATA